MIKSVFEKWIEINQIALTNDNYCCEYYIGEKCKTKVYFGIVDAIKVVYLEFDKTTLNNYKPVQINGLKIDVKQVDFISRDKEYICVENENNKDEIFIAFCSTLCDNLVDTSSYISAVNVFEDTIKYYKDFFSKTNSQSPVPNLIILNLLIRIKTTSSGI